MILTYKELFDKYALPENEIDDCIYNVTDELYVRTPTGHSEIRIVFKKQGTGLACTLSNGEVIKGERRHTVMTSQGLMFLEDALDVQHLDGFQAIVRRTEIEDTEFYDIGIDAPHLYIGLDGCTHHNTYTIMQTVKKEGLTSGKDFVKLSGKASPLAIYQTLFMYRNEGLVIFDDLDSMWGNEDATNILKAALDTSPVREISWGSSNTVNVSKMSKEERKEFEEGVDKKLSENPEKVKLPNQFEFTGRVIFISNLKKEEFDSAIMSRSAKINMDLTPTEILQRMRSVLPTLGGDDINMERKQELLDHLLEMHKQGDLDMVTMREFVKGMNILRSGAPNWKDLIQYA